MILNLFDNFFHDFLEMKLTHQFYFELQYMSKLNQSSNLRCCIFEYFSQQGCGTVMHLHLKMAHNRYQRFWVNFHLVWTRDRVVPNQITTKHKPPPIPIPKVTSEIVDLSRSSAKRKRSSIMG